MTFAARLPLLSNLLAAFTVSVQRRDEIPIDPRADRTMLDEIMQRCPDAFGSEHDLQYLAWVYPGRF